MRLQRGRLGRAAAFLAAACITSLAVPAAAFDADTWYLPRDDGAYTAGANWIRIGWPVPPFEGYDHVRVDVTPHWQCPGTQPYTSTYTGTSNSITFRGTGPNGMYRYDATAFDADGNVLGEWVDVVGTPATAKVSIDPIPGPVVAGTPVTVTGKLVVWDCMSEEFEPRARELILQKRAVGGDWVAVDAADSRGHYDTVTETEDVLGRVWFKQFPTASAEYRLFYAGLYGSQPAYSDPVAVAVDGSGELSVQPTSLAYKTLPSRSYTRVARISPRVTGTLSSSAIRRGRAVTVAGSVWPRHAGQLVLLQRRFDGRWLDVRTVRLDSYSRYRMQWEPLRAGAYVLRVAKRADYNHATGLSPWMRLTVLPAS